MNTLKRFPSVTSPKLSQSTDGVQENHWVGLTALPSPYSFHQALLLCENTEGQWVAWVPDFGEILLNPAQFYRLDP